MRFTNAKYGDCVSYAEKDRNREIKNLYEAINPKISFRQFKADFLETEFPVFKISEAHAEEIVEKLNETPEKNVRYSIGPKTIDGGHSILKITNPGAGYGQADYNYLDDWDLNQLGIILTSIHCKSGNKMTDKKAAHGGARPGAGKKPVIADAKRFSLYLASKTVDALDEAAKTQQKSRSGLAAEFIESGLAKLQTTDNF